MKSSRIIITLLCALTLITSCTGIHEDYPDRSGLILEADRTTAVASEGQTVTFAVKFNGEDVTAQATINRTDEQQTIALDGNTFSTYVPGVYKFVAVYNRTASEPVEITYSNTSGSSGNFYRNVGILYFTGSWCTYCPQMGTALEKVMSDIPDRVIPVAIHGSDEYSLGFETTLATSLGVSGYPKAIVDFRTPGYSQNTILIKNAVNESLTEYPAACGIKATTNDSGSAITIETDVQFTRTDYYRIWAVVLQDGIKGSQSGYSGVYTFNNVIRSTLTVIKGEEIGQHGAGEEYHHTFTVGHDADMDLSSFRVAIAIMSRINNTDKYYITNIVTLPLTGSIDYRYEKEE